jgi:hypothetical protein
MWWSSVANHQMSHFLRVAATVTSHGVEVDVGGGRGGTTAKQW